MHLVAANVWYTVYMTKVAEILDRVQHWPAQRQEDVVRAIERMESAGTDSYQLSDEEVRLIDEGLASPLVSEEDMHAFWNRHGI